MLVIRVVSSFAPRFFSSFASRFFSSCSSSFCSSCSSFALGSPFPFLFLVLFVPVNGVDTGTDNGSVPVNGVDTAVNGAAGVTVNGSAGVAVNDSAVVTVVVSVGNSVKNCWASQKGSTSWSKLSIKLMLLWSTTEWPLLNDEVTWASLAPPSG